MITMEAVAESERALLASLWHERASSESSVGNVMAQLAAELRVAGAHAEVIALAERAAGYEARHAHVCGELAAAYHGGPLAIASTPGVRLPDYVESPRLRAALHAVNLCCIGESIASAFVEACMNDCAGDALREINGQHLADEVRHARIGWAHVATLTREERDAIATWLPELLRVQLHAWESRIGELPEHGVRGHGYPPRAALIATVHGAVREVVLPGFDYVEIDTAAARAWFATRAV